MPLYYMAGAAFAGLAFIVTFIRAEAGLYLVLFSMLLSPEFGSRSSAKEIASQRAVSIRVEDLLLVVISLSWLARMAVNKDLGLAVKNRLNRPIMAYIGATLLATLVGFMTGTVKSNSAWFYVLKYVEYFVVFYMTLNNLRDRGQAWRFVMTAFITAGIVSVIGISQIPSGQRVSAPFEGDAGEPNTFGGYLLLMIAIVAGLVFETERHRVRAWGAALLGLMAVPFAYTLSRASYLGFIPMALSLAVFSRRRRTLLIVYAFILLFTPLLFTNLMPKLVQERVNYTFKAQFDQPTVRVGKVGFDPSTSERLLSMRDALQGWTYRPILGYGVTGFRFMDAQYFRTLVETGIIGLGCFLWLAVTTVRASTDSLGLVRDPDDRGLVLGFLAGTIGLLTHAIGSNTFIIIRVMEPFWFFMAIIVALPMLEDRQAAPVEAARPVRVVPLPMRRYST